MVTAHEFSLQEVAMRLGFALAAGFLLGFERESRGRAAGLKTTVLVCMSAAIAMLLSEKYYRDSFLELGTNSGWRPDPARLAAGILAGMGFIGGGVIIQQGNLVRGVTTASVLWFVTIVGFCFGGGHFRLGLIGTGLGLGVLSLLPLLENYIPNDWYGTLTVTTLEKGPSLAQLKSTLSGVGITAKSAEWELDLIKGTRTVHMSVKFKKGNLLEIQQEAISKLSHLRDVTWIAWKT
ncbi:MAG: MgtC/SapB family protein [Verrucomicrobiales bacterium]